MTSMHECVRRASGTSLYLTVPRFGATRYWSSEARRTILTVHLNSAVRNEFYRFSFSLCFYANLRSYISPHSIIRTCNFGLPHQRSSLLCSEDDRWWGRGDLPIIRSGRCVLDLPHHQHPLYDPSEYAVLAVEKLCGSAGDEELV